MSEHGWPDFHDDGLHHDDGAHHDDLPQPEVSDDPGLLHHDDDGYFDDAGGDFGHDTGLEHAGGPGHDAGPEPAASATHEPPAWEEHQLDPGDEPQHVVGADLDALPEPDAAEAVTSFPPVLDVGPLPEPVDGFPWIDTGSLGLVDPAAVHVAGPGGVSPAELADYAGADLPPGQDPWAVLADNDDAAISALAKWWNDHQP